MVKYMNTKFVRPCELCLQYKSWALVYQLYFCNQNFKNGQRKLYFLCRGGDMVRSNMITIIFLHAKFDLKKDPQALTNGGWLRGLKRRWNLYVNTK